MRIFLDSSALVKRYVDEEGSGDVELLCAEASAVFASSLCLPEIISALNRCYREKRLTREQYQKCNQAFVREFNEMEICPVIPEVLQLSVQLLEKCPLRAMDALHLASAICMKADFFVSFDHQQLQAAKIIGLKTAPLDRA